jgi:flagellar protein FlaI
VYVFHRKHGMLLTNIDIENDDYVLNVVERIARDVARRVDTNTPLLDARLPSGDRVNATLKPASVDGPSLTIRKFREDPYTIVNLINFKTLSPATAAFLWLAVEGMQGFPSNILVSGGTSSGKTTFLNCISMFIRPTDRVLTIEDTAELRLPLEHWVRMETRPPSIEGTGEISMDVLLKNSLRMRPDRIIVGEVRHDEAFTLFTAMNTGHQGSMGTIHANTSEETMVRLMSPPMNVPEQMATALNLVVVLNRINVPKLGLKRRVTEIAEVTGTRKPELHMLYEWDSSRDEIVLLDENSIVKKAIHKFSGISQSSIDQELKIREELLTEAAKKNISSLDSFSIFLKKYYEKQR